ncbi:MAG: PaaI family thioesterase [Desulfobacteraceae bacterium]|nr:MAG: PaaI family thioesterase [Desulfobacteraceae bacterium]
MDKQALAEFFTNDRFAALTGAELVEAGQGYCKTRLEIREHHLNAANVVQGGAIFTLADFAFAVASNSHGKIALAVNVNISFLKSVTKGTLIAEARELAQPGRLGAYEVRVTNEKGELVAQFNGMVYRKREELPVQA